MGLLSLLLTASLIPSMQSPAQRSSDGVPGWSLSLTGYTASDEVVLIASVSPSGHDGETHSALNLWLLWQRNDLVVGHKVVPIGWVRQPPWPPVIGPPPGAQHATTGLYPSVPFSSSCQWILREQAQAVREARADHITWVQPMACKANRCLGVGFW